MNAFTLQFSNKAMEAEYTELKCGTIAENVKIMLYFLGLAQITTGIPALINKNYLAFGVALALIVSMFLISFLGSKLKNYRQFMAFFIQAVFQFSRPYYVPSEMTNTATDGIFRGFAFASIQISVMSRFPSWGQKLLGVILSFVIKFALSGPKEDSIFDPWSVVRNIVNSIFVAYIFYSNDKIERLVFKNYYEHREKLAKFKELVESYLPQSIVIMNPSTNKSLFANQAFEKIFNNDFKLVQKHEENNDTSEENLQTELAMLAIEKGTIIPVGSSTPLVKSNDNISYLRELMHDYTTNHKLDYKALSLQASGFLESSRHLFSVIMTKLRWEGENAVAIILNDITYQESILALKLADENKDKIIATVSHELRTPLNGIIGILGIAQKKIKQQDILEYIDLCTDNAQLLLGLVNSLLDLQQIKQGKLKLNPARVSLQKILKDVTRLFQFQCEQKNITLSHNITPNTFVSIITDENRLKQILINLIGNALKFTFHGGITLGVTQDTDADYLRAWVADTGIGIKKEDIGKLFKMYGKLKDGESVNKNGVGLGLTISNALAELLGGKEIEVESVFGAGTKFSFRLSKDLLRSQEDNKNDEATTIREKRGYDTDASFDKEFMNTEYGEEHLLAATNRSRMHNYTFTKSIAITDKGPQGMPEKDLNEEESRLDESLETRIRGEILVVDDNPFNLMIAENLIKEMGYVFESAKSGTEAIEKVKCRPAAQPFKVILMDCFMPIMDGFEATKILKTLMEQKNIPEIPIIALTANQGEEDMRKCLESGMTDFLLKPLLSDNLQKILDRIA